jgi:hypothetical protein
MERKHLLVWLGISLLLVLPGLIVLVAGADSWSYSEVGQVIVSGLALCLAFTFGLLLLRGRRND